MRERINASTAILAALMLFGCGSGPSAPTTPPVTGTSGTPAASAPAETGGVSRTPRRPVQLGGSGSAAEATSVANQDRRADSVVSALQPLQVLLGKWNGTSRNKAQFDQSEWLWDFQSDRAQPSLLMRSENGAYIREGRLTFLPDLQRYQFSWKNTKGEQHVLRGEFTQPVQDAPGDNDKKLQRTYKLQLTGEPEQGEQWQLAFHQQENNRYILEIDRRRGSGAYQRVDTVHTQRDGTSFALSDSDYGEKTCIISQGLGTMSVSYKGQSYWVCCSGCKAAFDEEPERWIAKWEEKKKMTKTE